MADYFLGVDIGTYESKGVIVDGTFHVVASHEEKHGMSYPAPGFFEHDAEKDWWGDFCKITHALLTESGVKKEEIRAVGASTLGADLVAVDRNCVALRPAMLYGIDARAGKEIAWLESQYSEEEILKFNGRPLCSNDIPPKMLWLKNNEPEIWQNAFKLITGSTYITAKLTGKYYIDRFLGLGAFSPLYDRITGEKDPEYCSLFCREDQLADLADTTDLAGAVTACAAEETGLLEGTPVIVGADDSGAEAISTGVLEKGDMMLQVGSSLYMIGLTDHLISDKRVWSGGFIIPGICSVQGGTNAAGTLTRWFRDTLFPEFLKEEQDGGENAFAAMADEAEKSVPGSHGLVMLPYIAGERTPLNDPKARGVVLGLSLQHTRADLYRAALESIGYSVRQHIEIFSENQVDIRKLYVVGGGTKNELWMQIIADITGRELCTSKVTLGASFGDAAMAAIGIGYIPGFPELRKYVEAGKVYVPREEYADIYARLSSIFCRAYPDTRKLMHELSEQGNS